MRPPPGLPTRLRGRVIREMGRLPFVPALAHRRAIRKAERETNRLARQRRVVMGEYRDDRFYLNVGANRFVRPDWRLLDYPSPSYSYKSFSPDLIDFRINLLECGPWPISDGTVDLIYCSHCLEHLTDDAVQRVFAEAWRTLKPGAVFRVSVPDMKLIHRSLERGDTSIVDRLGLGTTPYVRLVSCFSYYAARRSEADAIQADFRSKPAREFFESYKFQAIDPATHSFSTHINWFDSSRLSEFAVATGFASDNVLRSGYRQSIAAEMRAAEFDRTKPEVSLFVDVVK